MSNTSKREYLAAIRARYRRSGKKDKQRTLDEFCQTCGYNRKYAIRLLNAAEGESRKRRADRRGAPRKYHSANMMNFLKTLWRASNLACGKRLKAMIADWLPHYDGTLTSEERQLLSTISAATIDRLLQPMRRTYCKLGLATTKPGSLLKKHIPIGTAQWDQTCPGFLEADTVAHCGTSMAGMFVFTVNCVDIATGWTEQRAVWGKGEHGVLRAIQDIERVLPFALRGFDCDNGSEFLNWHLMKYLTERPQHIQFTRSREYQKNDNAHVEGKNYTHIRQYLGYQRFDDLALVGQLNALYTTVWRLFFNFFIPSVKLIDKHRVGSKLIKIHDTPTTPYHRLLASSQVSDDVKHSLADLKATLNPFILQRTIKVSINTILTKVSQPAPDQSPTPESVFSPEVTKA
jgi:hypothetical protein